MATQAGKRYPSYDKKHRDMRARRDAETDAQRDVTSSKAAPKSPGEERRRLAAERKARRAASNTTAVHCDHAGCDEPVGPNFDSAFCEYHQTHEDAASRILSAV